MHNPLFFLSNSILYIALSFVGKHMNIVADCYETALPQRRVICIYRTYGLLALVFQKMVTFINTAVRTLNSFIKLSYKIDTYNI
jgi:hypothetical protein